MFYNECEVMNMLDRTLPPKYQTETDYRKIPRQYLNARIPMGRGIVKWAPFKMISTYNLLRRFQNSSKELNSLKRINSKLTVLT